MALACEAQAAVIAAAVIAADSDGKEAAVIADSDAKVAAVTAADSDAKVPAVTAADSNAKVAAVIEVDFELDKKAATIESVCPIGSHIELIWSRKNWYRGVVTKYDITDDEHYVDYDDDVDEQYEDLKTMRWRFVEKCELPVDANESVQGVAPGKAISMLWKGREESCFSDLRGRRKVAVVMHEPAVRHIMVPFY